MNSDSVQKVLESGPGPLSRIINLDGAALPEWREQDLRAMLLHQLAAPLAFDLRHARMCGDDGESRTETLDGARRLGIITFRDLFVHPKPPLQLLKLAKNLFKHQSGASSERRPEQQVAYVLYLLTILAARERCGESITRLTKAEVLRSADWAASRKWVDAGTKTLLGQAHAE